MGNKTALSLAVAAFLLMIVCQVFVSSGTAIVMLWVGILLAVWPLRLRRGTAGREQWSVIRTKGKVHFVLTYGIGFAVMLLGLHFGTNYLAFHRFVVTLFIYESLLCFSLGGVLAFWLWRDGERKGSPLN